MFLRAFGDIFMRWCNRGVSGTSRDANLNKVMACNASTHIETPLNCTMRVRGEVGVMLVYLEHLGHSLIWRVR